jgi:hypothetical protein
MEQKNGVQETLRKNGVLFKIDEMNDGMPEIISEETFVQLLEMNIEGDSPLPQSIDDEGWENDDLDGDGLTFV